jgi:hypothetical protein
MLTHQSWTDHTALKKEGFWRYPQHADWLICGFPPNSSLLIVIEAVGLSQASIDEYATSVYWTHISSMWSVHSILPREANPSILNRYRRGLQSWWCWLCILLSPPSQLTALRFLLCSDMVVPHLVDDLPLARSACWRGRYTPWIHPWFLHGSTSTTPWPTTSCWVPWL